MWYVQNLNIAFKSVSILRLRKHFKNDGNILKFFKRGPFVLVTSLQRIMTGTVKFIEEELNMRK